MSLYGVRDLGVPVEVPEVEAAARVHGSEQRGVSRGPAHVRHVVAAVLERVQRLVLLEHPLWGHLHLHHPLTLH